MLKKKIYITGLGPWFSTVRLYQNDRINGVRVKAETVNFLPIILGEEIEQFLYCLL